MPKKKRTREEKATESYFPVDESDLRYAVEKEFKSVDRKTLQTIEGSAVKKRAGKAVRKKAKKKSVRKSRKSKTESYVPPRVKLKKEGYELVITEKPQAAAKISNALGKAVRRTLGSVSYYDVDRDGEKIVVACAVGHLFTLAQKSSAKGIPIFDLQWVPNYLVRKADFTKKYYDTILKLVRGASSVTIATDYDVEGEVIGLNIVRYLCGQADARRMKFSTLTAPELNKAYDEKSSSINWGQAIAGETRHYLDWIYGINLSRALMDAIKTTGKFRIMSIGRVQGPALNIIVNKERAINDFKPRKYWQVFVTIKNSHEIELKYDKDIFVEAELDSFSGLEGKKMAVSTEKKSQKISPYPPFNLTVLQTEAYRLHGITPSRTLQIAQSLYLAGLISYPRTSSQKLPPSIGYKNILRKLISKYNAEKLITRERPVEGKKTDSAHPSIYPTGENEGAALSAEETKIYDLIARRFISLFCEDAVIERKTIRGVVDDLKFSLKGSSWKEKGWTQIYPVKMDEKEIPDLTGEFDIIKVRTEEKETQPPRRYSQASIISELEKRNLGTKATRSSILETLYDRDYVRNKNVEATPLGMSLISTLEKYSPIIIDEELTRKFERETEEIFNLKKNFEIKEKKVIDEAKDSINKIIDNFDKNKSKIGGELLQANINFREQQREENKLRPCSVCGKGNLIINYSKKNRRYFVACDAYPNCKNTYSLPPNGVIKKVEKTCEDCGFPMLMRLSKGKRPWIFCFNPECPKNKERLEEYRKRQEESV
jgi:DNA topoisomerase-1